MESTLKTVPLTLGGKQRHLRFDVNALISLGDELKLNLMSPEGWEEIFGKSYPQSHPAAQKAIEAGAKPDDSGKVFVAAPPQFRKVRAIVWAGLLHEDESLTIRQVGAMLDPLNLQTVVDAYTQAFTVQDVLESADPKEQPLASVT